MNPVIVSIPFDFRILVPRSGPCPERSEGIPAAAAYGLIVAPARSLPGSRGRATVSPVSEHAAFAALKAEAGIAGATAR